MSNVLYFPNMHQLGQKPTSTGVQVTAADATVHACLDVFARNDASNPLITSPAATTANLLSRDIHDASTANINASGGAYVAFGTAITIPAGTFKVQISSTMGEPVEISFASAIGTAAASTKKVFIVEGGAPGTLDFIPGANNKIFVKSLSLNAIASGYIAINFMG